MFRRAFSAVLNGIESRVVQVEADVSCGLPYFELVGYLSGEVKESRERVKTAIRNSGYTLDPRRIIVNLSPADRRKSGTSYDLAIACAVLSAYGFISQQAIEDTVIVGELSLDGRIRGVKGILPTVLMAREGGMKRCIVPAENAFEGAAAEGIAVYGVHTLRESIAFLSGSISLDPAAAAQIPQEDEEKAADSVDFSDIHGQRLLKRSMEIAAAGMHNILIIGPPGAGKSMAAKRLPGILPLMSPEESLEVSKIYSVSGLLRPGEGLIRRRPFRSPHHTISAAGLAGGGRIPAPGEISLAHRGVLFLDELTEFDSEAMEALRQPMEDGRITINRLQASCVFPADFMLAAAINPCRCGFYPDMTKCRCTPLQIQRYIGRISRPLLDRIDITVEVRAVEIEMLQAAVRTDESSADIRERVIRAAGIQSQRYAGSDFEHNSQIPDKRISEFCALGEEESEFMKNAYRVHSLSARSYNKILRVARTIADLAGDAEISIDHLSEAVFYKSLDRRYWSGII